MWPTPPLSEFISSTAFPRSSFYIPLLWTSSRNARLPSRCSAADSGHHGACNTGACPHLQVWFWNSTPLHFFPITAFIVPMQWKFIAFLVFLVLASFQCVLEGGRRKTAREGRKQSQKVLSNLIKTYVRTIQN